MPRQSTLEWQVLTEQSEWPIDAGDVSAWAGKSPAAHGETAVFGVQWGKWLWLCSIALAAILGSGLMLWREAKTGVAQIETELADAVTAEQWLQGTDHTADAMVDPAVAASWRETASRDVMLTWLAADPPAAVEVVDWTIQGDVAAVQAVMTLAETGERYRQTRFYRHTAGGWLRTEPQPQVWGPARTHRTDHLLFRYQQRDERAVKVAAVAVEAVYATLASVLDLSAADGPLVFEVSVRRDGPGIGSTHPPLVVTSPATMPAPAQMDEAAMLTRSVVLSLLEYVRAEVALRDGPKLHLLSIVDALLLWQLNEAHVLPSPWHQNAVRAVYRPGAVHTDTANRELCAMGKLWDSAPLQNLVLILCHDTDSNMSLSGWTLVQQARTSLDEFYIFSPAWQRLLQGYQSGQLIVDENDDHWTDSAEETLALATVVEYVAMRFGQDGLRAMVATAEELGAWDSMVQEQLGVPLPEFETGWQEYVTTTYLADGS